MKRNLITTLLFLSLVFIGASSSLHGDLALILGKYDFNLVSRSGSVTVSQDYIETPQLILTPQTADSIEDVRDALDPDGGMGLFKPSTNDALSMWIRKDGEIKEFPFEPVDIDSATDVIPSDPKTEYLYARADGDLYRLRMREFETWPKQ